MYGFSIYLDKDLDEKTEEYIKSMAASGFKGIFTSCHIPEDDQSNYFDRLSDLGKLAKENNLELMVDISENALEKLNTNFSNVNSLKELGVTGIRADFGISFKNIARMSRKIKVALNGSTLTQMDIDELKNYGAYFSNLEAWHNYYPRPETGLGKGFFKDKNKWLKSLGLKVMAFVPGDMDLRGPIHDGLPTLEVHRHENVFVSAMELEKVYKLDKIYIGDSRISNSLMEHFYEYIVNGIYILHGEVFDNFKDLKVLNMIQRNRDDSAEYVIRSKESRKIIKEEVKLNNAIERPAGSITMDNIGYGRYNGEIQITKMDLPQNELVNVIGKIDSKDIGILKYINGGGKFKIEF